MSDFKRKLELFFGSDSRTFGELSQKLQEAELKASAQVTWDDAVMLFRKGMKRLKDNDLEGMSDIKQANEHLKNVIKVYSTDDVEKKVAQLNESINELNVADIEESTEILEYQLGTLRNRLQEAGLSDAALPITDGTTEDGADASTDEIPAVDATDEIPADEIPADEIPADGTSDGTASASAAGDEISQDAKRVVASANKLGVPTLEEEDGVLDGVISDHTSDTPVSVYDEGFMAGRKAWSKDCSYKDACSKMVEETMQEESYGHVKRWEEGFKAGYTHEEQVRRDHGEFDDDTSKEDA